MAVPERLTSRAVATMRAEAASINRARVWVIEDTAAAQALGIAERLGTPFRRLPMTWNWRAHAVGLSRAGSIAGVATGMEISAATPPPKLVISAGRRSAAVALWLKARHGCTVVHCTGSGVAGPLRRGAFDLLVSPEHDMAAAVARDPPTNVLPVLGVPHRLSPARLAAAATRWAERLEHLPHPRVAVLVGGALDGGPLSPARAHGLGRAIARLAALRGGSVVAATSRRTGTEATDALAAGLGSVMHLIYRQGEPGDNPTDGFVATADVVVVAAHSAVMISEACAAAAAVYVATADHSGPRHRRMVARFVAARQLRPFDGSIAPYSRVALDEAGRVAAEIVRRFGHPDAASRGPA